MLVAVISATALAAVWHVDHDAEQHCAICKLGHEPLADLAADTPVAPPEPVGTAPHTATQRLLAAATAPAPARGPPLS